MALLTENIELGCVSQDSPQKKSILRENENLGSNCTAKFSKTTMRHAKIRENKVHRGESFNNANLRREFHGLQNLRKERKTKPEARAMRPQRRMGPGKGCLKTRTEGKYTFYSPAEAWVMPAPSSTNPEERELVIDSGASMHKLSKKSLQRSADERGSTIFCARSSCFTVHKQVSLIAKLLKRFKVQHLSDKNRDLHTNFCTSVLARTARPRIRGKFMSRELMPVDNCVFFDEKCVVLKRWLNSQNVSYWGPRHCLEPMLRVESRTWPVRCSRRDCCDDRQWQIRRWLSTLCSCVLKVSSDAHHQIPQSASVVWSRDRPLHLTFQRERRHSFRVTPQIAPSHGHRSQPATSPQDSQYLGHDEDDA